MTRSDRPRWGRLTTPDVLVDVVLIAGLGYAAKLAHDRLELVAFGCLIGVGTFLAGLSILVRGCVLPEYFDRRALKAQREVWQAERQRRQE